MLTVEHASVHYPVKDGAALQALDDVSLTIGEGEFVVLVGASGCGKTTLLSAIAGFQKLTGGSIRLDGAEIRGPGRDRGVVFQKDNLLPWANAADNVAFGLKLQGMGRRARRERARELLSQVGLDGFAETPPHALSGGMRQRVGLARALATEPKILLMDEPLGALDGMTRETMQELIARVLAGTKKRILFITHSTEEALFLGTSILVMSPRPGRIAGRFESRYIHSFLDGRDAASIKSDPGFVETRKAIRELVRANGPS